MTPRLKKILSVRVRYFTQSWLRLRVRWYRLLSDCSLVEGNPDRIQPVLMTGKGTISFGQKVVLGWSPSPSLYSGYSHFEARSSSSKIVVGHGSMFNNNSTIISDGPGVFIGSDCLVGPGFTVFDSDFHPTDPTSRKTGQPKAGKIQIGDNVFIGANVTILRGSTIGTDSVVGAGSVVRGSFPQGAIIVGNPAVVVGMVSKASE